MCLKKYPGFQTCALAGLIKFHAYKVSEKRQLEERGIGIQFKPDILPSFIKRLEKINAFHYLVFKYIRLHIGNRNPLRTNIRAFAKRIKKHDLCLTAILDDIVKISVWIHKGAETGRSNYHDILRQTLTLFELPYFIPG